jgi:diguanylate cyclase (GGDEF)-like protein/PAS domain S-box-containing protein
MRTAGKWDLARWAWPVVIVTAILLGALLALTLVQNFDAERELAHSRAQQQLQLISNIVSNELQGDNYQEIEPLLDHLAQSDGSIAGIELVAVNGFVIAQYHRPRAATTRIRLESAIAYSYHRAAVLNLEIDLSPVEVAQRRLALEVGAIYALFCGLMALLSHIALRRYREAAQLRLADAQLRDTNRTLHVLSNCNQALVRATSEAELMNELCRILVDEGGYSLAWIGNAEHDEGLKVRPVAAKGKVAYLDAVQVSWARTIPGEGPTGRAIRGGQPIIIRDILTDDRVRPWRELAREFGFRSSISLPLGNCVPAVGALNIYSDLPARFSSDEVRLLEELAKDLSYGIQSLGNDLRRRDAEEQIVRQGRRFRALVESSTDGVVLVRGGGTITYVGPSITRILGFLPADMEGHSAFEFIHPDDAPAIEAVLRQCLQTSAKGVIGSAGRARDRSGQWRYLDATFTNLVDDPDVMGVVINFRDITERLALERERQESNERFVQIAENVNEVFWVSETDGFTLRYVSPAYERIWQRPVAQITANPRAWLEHIHPDDVERVRSAVAEKTLQGQFDEEYRILRADGTVRWIRDRAFPVRDAQGRIYRVVGTVEDVTERKVAAEHIQYLAYFDQLTGLANRTLFNDRLNQRLSGAEAGGDPIGVVLVDVDRFRFVNDSLGRQAGDELIRQIGGRLTQFTGDAGVVARTGSNQFAVVLDANGGAADVAHRMGQLFTGCFDAPYPLGSEELHIAVKAGIALAPDDGTDAEVVQRNAEAALQNAKSSGEKFLFYAPHMNEKVAHKLSLESKLQAALARDEFLLHYQPKVNLRTGAVEGVEALIRWRSPDLGLVQPLDFIPILEETGLILDVGTWVIRRAALDYREWLAAGIPAPRVAVNVSAVQLRRHDFVQTLRDALSNGTGDVGVDIEITESLLMEDIDGNVKKLEAARDMGIRIAVDDFGTGYSSLRYLAMLPAHTLKIDRSFVVTMLAQANVMTLVSTVISMAHSLGLDVVAEGVDQAEQAQALAELGCDQMQGYLISRPVPKEQLLAWLRERAAPQRVIVPA